MSRSRTWPAWLLLAVAACGSATEPIVPPVPPPVPPPVTPPAVPVYTSLWLSDTPPIIVAGGRVFASAYALRSTLEVDFVSARWESTDTTRLRPDLREAPATWLRAVGTGEAVVTVRLGDLSSSATFLAIPRPGAATPQDSAPVVITDFHVAEAGTVYFPRIAMRALRPGGLVAVEMTLTLGGVPRPLVCSGFRAIGQSSTVVVGSPEDDDPYDGWDYADVGFQPSRVPTSREAALSMIVTDSSGRSWRIDATGPITATPPPFAFRVGEAFPWGCEQ